MKEKLTGQLTTTMICTTCNTPAQGQYNDFNCLTLFLPKRGFKTIDDALKKRFRAASLERTCPTCNSKRAQQREVINTLPQVLVLQMGRFQNSREKIQTDIQIKNQIDMSKYYKTTSQTCVYTLKSVINHIGDNIDGGHYNAFVKTAEKQWTAFDDLHVSRIEEEEVFNKAKKSCYLAFFDPSGC